MIIQNTTKICNEFIKFVCEFVEFDLSEDGLLVIEYSGGIKQACNDGILGVCRTVMVDRPVYMISVVAHADTLTLVHELRHAAQGQQLGIELFNELYEMESESEGYWANVFEEDSRDYEMKYSKWISEGKAA